MEGVDALKFVDKFFKTVVIEGGIDFYGNFEPHGGVESEPHLAEATPPYTTQKAVAAVEEVVCGIIHVCDSVLMIGLCKYTPFLKKTAHNHTSIFHGSHPSAPKSREKSPEPCAKEKY